MTGIVGEFQLGLTIGTGTFGKVKQGLHLPTSQPVAIKVLEKKRILTKKDLRRIDCEMQILKMVDHPYIVKLLQLIETQNKYYIVTELVEGEELFEKINRLGKIAEPEAAIYFGQLVDAISYLNDRSICHRDIKPENIIVRDSELKVIDFGLSSIYDNETGLNTSCGSPCYAAPQMLAGRPYDPEKTDIWAIGVTLYAMLSGTLPFEHSSTKQLYDVINIGKYKELEHVSYSLRDLMRKMIEVDPKLRICFQKMKSHPWFSASPQKQLSNRFGLNEKVLAIMQSIFNIPQIDLRKQLKNKLSWTYLTYYHLLCKKIKTTNKNSLALMRKHEGPVHIKHIFKNFETAKIEVERTFAKTVWVSEFEAYGEEGVRVEIKSLANMCYLDWSKSAVEKWLRTK